MFAVVAGMRVDPPGRSDGPICITSGIEDGQTKLNIRLSLTGIPTFISMIGHDRNNVSRLTGANGYTNAQRAEFCRYIGTILGFAKFTRNESELAMLELRGQYSAQGKTELNPERTYSEYPALVFLRGFCRYLQGEGKF